MTVFNYLHQKAREDCYTVSLYYRIKPFYFVHRVYLTRNESIDSVMQTTFCEDWRILDYKIDRRGKKPPLLKIELSFIDLLKSGVKHEYIGSLLSKYLA